MFKRYALIFGMVLSLTLTLARKMEPRRKTKASKRKPSPPKRNQTALVLALRGIAAAARADLKVEAKDGVQVAVKAEHRQKPPMQPASAPRFKASVALRRRAEIYLGLAGHVTAMTALYVSSNAQMDSVVASNKQVSKNSLQGLALQ